MNPRNRIEQRLIKEVRTYLNAIDKGDEDYHSRWLNSILAYLLSTYLESDVTWPKHERWIDGMINGRIERTGKNAVQVTGLMVWGLSSDVGGHQWAEPLEAEITLSEKRKELISYMLRFASKGDLDRKLVPTGSYSTTIPAGRNKMMSKTKPRYHRKKSFKSYVFVYEQKRA